MLLKMKKRRR